MARKVLIVEDETNIAELLHLGGGFIALRCEPLTHRGKNSGMEFERRVDDSQFVHGYTFLS